MNKINQKEYSELLAKARGFEQLMYLQMQVETLAEENDNKQMLINETAELLGVPAEEISFEKFSEAIKVLKLQRNEDAD